MHLARTTLAVAALLAVSACGGTQAPSAPAPAPQQPSQAAPASSAPASKAAQGKPSTPPAQLALTGNVAGMDFTPVSDEDRAKAGGIAGSAANAKIEPASCQKVVKYAQASDPATAGSSSAQAGGAMYVAGVAATNVSLKQMRTDWEGCPKVTMDMGGVKATMEVKVVDADAAGASDTFAVQQTTTVAGQSVRTYVVNGSVRGLFVNSTGMGQSVDQAKVADVFAAQVDKVAKAQ